jgi:hypothetical protein
MDAHGVRIQCRLLVKQLYRTEQRSGRAMNIAFVMARFFSRILFH